MLINHENEYKINYNNLIEEEKILKEKFTNYDKNKDTDYKKLISTMKIDYEKEIERYEIIT